MKKVFLLPGQMTFSTIETEVTTILGSCVAVALYDPKTKIGGMNHYLLPKPTKGEAPSGRYGSHANASLLSQIIKAGANKKTLIAKVYGGGNVMG